MPIPGSLCNKCSPLHPSHSWYIFSPGESNSNMIYPVEMAESCHLSLVEKQKNFKSIFMIRTTAKNNKGNGEFFSQDYTAVHLPARDSRSTAGFLIIRSC